MNTVVWTTNQTSFQLSMANLNEEDCFWLQTTYQNAIEVALQLSKAPAPEQTPFVRKYEAIEILKDVLTRSHPYTFIVHCVLGELYNDVEQLSDSVRSYQAALSQLTSLPPSDAVRFYQYLLIVYNMLGLSYVNREDVEQGLGCLAKATQLYQAFKAAPGEDVHHNRSDESRGKPFRFFYEGGNDHDQVEDSYTLTQFYLAQAYTKTGLKDKAAEYCGLTLQRQHNSGKYDLKDFVNNLVGLSEYYQGSKLFSQAQYLLMLATKALPEGRKRKLRATVHISLGNLLAELLEFSATRLQQQNLLPADNELVGKEVLLFKEFTQPFPHLVLPTDIQGCKSLFRQANTQLKKAIDVFVLDGYVTEHIEILHAQSKLYKSLTRLEKNSERQAAMLEKRKELLEPLLTELNPKAYPASWQRILVEVSEIVNDLFNVRVAQLSAKGIPSEQKITNSRNLGLKSAHYYREIIKTLEEDKEVPRNEQYFRSIINSKINIAKATSKLMSSDRKARVEFLKQSWQLYQGIMEFIKNDIPEECRGGFDKEAELTKDMIAMMPAKIDRINYGQLSFVE